MTYSLGIGCFLRNKTRCVDSLSEKKEIRWLFYMEYSHMNQKILSISRWNIPKNEAFSLYLLSLALSLIFWLADTLVLRLVSSNGTYLSLAAKFSPSQWMWIESSLEIPVLQTYFRMQWITSWKCLSLTADSRGSINHYCRTNDKHV